MFIGAFGDSFLYGSDFDDCNDDAGIASQKTYPALIANKLNGTCINFSVPGCGNKYIADQICKCIQINKDKVFYLINWSWIDRHDYVVEDSQGKLQKPRTIFDYVTYNNFQNKWATILPGASTKISKFYYKELHHQYNDKLENLLVINSTLSLLKNNNCNYLMTFMDYLLLDTEFYNTSSITLLQDTCKPDLKSYSGYNFLDWSKHNNYLISQNWHPLEEAHQAAAEYWLPKVRTLLNSSAKEESHASIRKFHNG